VGLDAGRSLRCDLLERYAIDDIAQAIDARLRVF
jgi:hypothetical protein